MQCASTILLCLFLLQCRALCRGDQLRGECSPTPGQHWSHKGFTGVPKSDKKDERGAYIYRHQSPLNLVQLRLAELTSRQPDGYMMSSVDQVQLLSNMLKFANAKKVIDIGVYTGFSALSWALSLPEDGKVIACDVSMEYANIGKPFWGEAGVDYKIDLRIAPASTTLQALIDNGEEGTFDMVYIDADKSSYITYYEYALKLLRPNGIVAVDNVWWSGRVAYTNSRDLNTATLQKLNEHITQDERVQAVMIDIGDGLFICRKK